MFPKVQQEVIFLLQSKVEPLNIASCYLKTRQKQTKRKTHRFSTHSSGYISTNLANLDNSVFKNPILRGMQVLYRKNTNMKIHCMYKCTYKMLISLIVLFCFKLNSIDTTGKVTCFQYHKYAMHVIQYKPMNH